MGVPHHQTGAYSSEAIAELNVALATLKMQSRRGRDGTFRFDEQWAWPITLVEKEIKERQELLARRCQNWFTVEAAR